MTPAASPLPPLSSLHRTLLYAMLLLYLFATLHAALFRLSPAQDEPSHVRSGLTMLTGSRYVDPAHSWWTSLDALHPPSDMLAGLAALATGESPDFRTHIHPAFGAIRAARCVNITLGLIILLLAFHWTRAVWGPSGGLLAVAALLAQPPFITHAAFVSSDLAMACGGLLAAFALWQYWLAAPDWLLATPRRFLAITLLLALVLLLATCAKVSNLAFLAVQGLVAFIALLQLRRTAPHSKILLRITLSLALSSALVLFGGALVWQLISPSRPAVTLFGHSLLLPFGQPFLFSIKTANSIQHLIATPVYFLHLRPPSWKFYAVAALLKTPWPLLLLLSALPIFAWRARRRLTPPQRLWLSYLLALSAGMVLLFSTRGIYLGLRHLLLPLLLAGVALAAWSAAQPRGRVFVHALLGGALLLTFTMHPWYASYFNFQRALPDPLPLVDSDSDWGQGLLALRDWQMQHPGETLWLAYFGNARPEDYGLRYRGLLAPYSFSTPDPELAKGPHPEQLDGFVAISATHLAGSLMFEAHQSGDYYAAWRALRPTAILGGSIYLYDARRTTPLEPHALSR
jgi:hypothetical protein